MTLFGQYYKESTFGLAVNIMLTAVFFAWIAIIIYKLCRRLTKIAIIWPLIVSLVALITSFITLFAKEAFASNLAFIIGIIFMEVFLIYLIVCDAYDNKNRLSRVIISSILFVTLGYVTFFYSSYGLEDKTIFNSLISIFSAIVGGGLTLGGVAWTIKKSDNDKKQEEIKKAKPIFDFSPIFDQPVVVSGSKNCFPEDEEKGYVFDVSFLIDNSDLSTFKLKRIMHDDKWFALTTNTTVLPNRKIMLSFKINEPMNIFLEVEDGLENLYYYKIELVNIGSLNVQMIKRHTARAIKEVSYEEIINNLKQSENK